MKTKESDTVPINGVRLRLMRKSKGMSQIHLANESHVSRSYIAEIEKGQKQPRILVANALAEALEVDLDDLLS